jgi:hypothetical protein
VPGSYQDNDNPPDDLVAWYPDPAMPNEKPWAGQDVTKIESIEADTPKAGTAAQNITFAPEGKPYSSVSTVGEAVAEFTTAFTNMFGANAPKALTTAFTNELQALQMSRSTKRAGKNENIVYQGVSPQERANILNKYLTTHAKNITGAAKLGDVKAQAALQKGNFGVTYTTLKNAYADNGIPFNEDSLLKITTESAINPDRLKSTINLINLQAKTYFPALADKIDKGYTVKQLLSPYLQTRANILEEDADAIDLKELQSVAKDPKGLMGLYDYEISLRKSPKWAYTKNAQDSLSSLARDMTKMFGLGA